MRKKDIDHNLIIKELKKRLEENQNNLENKFFEKIKYYFNEPMEPDMNNSNKNYEI
jgi:hypothetical protein